MENINKKKMNNNSTSDYNHNKMTKAVNELSTKGEVEAMGALYRVAARNLREYHGVPSMTPVNLKNTMALLQLRPSRLVAQGLGPQRLLQGASLSRVPLTSDSSEEDEGEPYESAADGVLPGVVDYNNSDSEPGATRWKDEDGGKCDLADSDSTNDDDSKKDVNKYKSEMVCGAHEKGKAKRPIHAALVAGGIKLRPRETRPLLRALGISPHRLVQLGLIEREALRGTSERGCGGHQLGRGCEHGHLRGGRGRTHGPPHRLPPGCHGGALHGRGPSGPMHGPPPPSHGPGHHGEDVHGEGEEDNMEVEPGLGQHGPRYHGGRRGGSQGPHHGPHRPGRNGMPKPGRGPSCGGMHSPPPPPCGPGHYGEHLHRKHNGEERMLMHGGPPCRRHGSGHHDVPVGRHPGPMHSHGSPGRVHDPIGSSPPPPHHGHPGRRHGPTHGGCEEAMRGPLGAGRHDGHPVCEGPRPDMHGLPHGPLHEEGDMDKLHWRMEHTDHSRPRRCGDVRGRGGRRGRSVNCGGGHGQHAHVAHRAAHLGRGRPQELEGY